MPSEQSMARARELLPCRCTRELSGLHRRNCPAHYRPAIATALDEAAQTAGMVDLEKVAAQLYGYDPKASIDGRLLGWNALVKECPAMATGYRLRAKKIAACGSGK